MNYIKCNVYGIAGDKMVDHFTHGFEPIIGCEVLKDNPQIFEEA